MSGLRLAVLKSASGCAVAALCAALLGPGGVAGADAVAPSDTHEQAEVRVEVGPARPLVPALPAPGRK